jgi:hypothetical protein
MVLLLLLGINGGIDDCEVDKMGEKGSFLVEVVLILLLLLVVVGEMETRSESEVSCTEATDVVLKDFGMMDGIECEKGSRTGFDREDS